MIPAPAPAITCSRPNCYRPATVHCEDCGAPVCPNHLVTTGSLIALRRTCGRCIGRVSAALSPAPMPAPPTPTGPFAKVVLPGEKPAAPLPPAPPPPPRQITRVVEAPKPPPRTGTPPERRVESVRERNSRILRDQAERGRSAKTTNDFAWFKECCREAAMLVDTHRPLEAMALLDALYSMPKKLSPTSARAEAEAWIAARRAEKLEYLRKLAEEGPRA